MRRYCSDSESDGDGNVASPSKAQAGQGYLQYIAEYENNQDSDEDASFTEQGQTSKENTMPISVVLLI